MTIKEAMEELKTPQYIGEEGDMAVNCKTKRGAWLKFRKQTRDDVSQFNPNLQKQTMRRIYQSCRHRMARNRHRLGAGEDRCQDGDRDVGDCARRDEAPGVGERKEVWAEVVK